MSKGTVGFFRQTVTMPDGYYSLALAALKAALDVCKQAGIALPPENEIRETDDAELEGVFLDLGSGMECSCRAARYEGADHNTDAGIVVSVKTGRLDGRAKISVLNEPANRVWRLYAQILPGCRTKEMEILCERLSVDLLTETKKEISEAEGFTAFLTIAQWTYGIIAASRAKAQ
jgi:hypothetical protein